MNGKSKTALSISHSIKIFFADYNNEGAYHNMALTCLNAHDKSVRWHQALGPTSGRFTIHEKVIYMIGWSVSHEDNKYRYNIFALQGDSGARLWSTPLESSPLMFVIDQPVVADGRVYVSFGHFPVLPYLTEICAFSQTDGKLLWQIQAPGHGRITQAGNGLVFMRSRDASVSAFQATSGALAWRTEVPLSDFLPLFQDDTLYACESFAHRSNIVALRASNGTLLWRSHYQTSYVTAFSLGKTHLYSGMHDSTSQQPPSLYALDLRTGDLVWRSSEMEVTREGVVEHDGVVYVPTSTNGFIALSAHTGQKKWRYKKIFSRPYTFLGLPVIADGKVFLKLNTRLSFLPFKGIVCLNAAHGFPRWYRWVNDLDMEGSIGLIQG